MTVTILGGGVKIGVVARVLKCYGKKRKIRTKCSNTNIGAAFSSILIIVIFLLSPINLS